MEREYLMRKILILKYGLLIITSSQHFHSILKTINRTLFKLEAIARIDNCFWLYVKCYINLTVYYFILLMNNYRILLYIFYYIPKTQFRSVSAV